MRALRTLAALGALALALAATPFVSPAAAAGECEPESPSFGLCGLDLRILDSKGTPALGAGTHPALAEVSIAVNTKEGIEGAIPVEDPRDLRVNLPPGFAGNPTAVPQCTAADFLAGNEYGECENASAIGVAEVEVVNKGLIQKVPIFNLKPSPGKAGKIGFNVLNRAPVVIDLAVNPNPPYNVITESTNISTAASFYRAKASIWGVPADPSHDGQRGQCVLGGSCPVAIALQPFLTLPTSCEGPLETRFEADSWQHPGQWFKAPRRSPTTRPSRPPRSASGVVRSSPSRPKRRPARAPIRPRAPRVSTSTYTSSTKG